MAAGKEDRRVLYTKKVIRESFLDLLDEKPVEKISVTEICKRADINRGTFYSHYADPFELKAALELELVQMLEDASATARQNGQEHISPLETLILISMNRDKCRVFCGPNGNIDSMCSLLIKYNADYLDRYISTFPDLTDSMRDCIKLMISSVVASVMKYWFDKGMDCDPNDLTYLLRTFIGHGVKGLQQGINRNG